MAVSRLNQQRIDGLRPRGKIYSIRDAKIESRANSAGFYLSETRI